MSVDPNTVNDDANKTATRDPEEGTNMTTTAIAPTTTSTGKIDQTINAKIQAILTEQNQLIKERNEVLHGLWVAFVAQEHMLMLGPGGTGKSFLVRDSVARIIGARLFECAFDETTDPSQVFGPPDIKAMVEDGKTRRVPTGMFPEAHFAFFDEFFNGNGPLLHSIMPGLNERVWHNNGLPSALPLRSMVAGTNKLNADADQAALWDRVHIRHVVDYVRDRNSQAELVGDAIARMASIGRGTSTQIAGATTTKITLDELDQAHAEALSLDVPDPVLDLFFDIRDELQHGSAKIQISDRRAVEGMAAVLANAWVRGHETVSTGDLDVLANMWWTVQDQISEARSVILAATNPGEKAALDLLDNLDDLKKELKQANDSDMDPSRKKRVGVEVVRNADKVRKEAQEHLDKARAAGTSTSRLEEVLAKADAFKVQVGKDVFGIDPASMAGLQNAGQ